MNGITIKNRSLCRWDAVALGEIMLRFDPGERRIKTARTFSVWEGGGEYNVVRGLKRCFGLNTTVVTGIPENELGHLLLDCMFQGGVDTSHIKWFPYDGMGWENRQGLNFVERGFGIDRAGSTESVVVVQWTFTGTHTGVLEPAAFGRRVEPTGRTIQLRGISVYDIDKELIQRETMYLDFATLWVELGVEL